MKEVQETAEKDFELVQVPASYATAIQTPTGEVLTMEQSITLILNILKDLDKRL